MVCSKKQIILCGSKECAICYPRSLYKWLDDRNLLSKFISCISDPNLDSLKISYGSKKICLFRCKKCEHIVDIDPKNYKEQVGCRYCDKKSLCNNDNCEQCYNNSLASCSDINKYWNMKENNISPRYITKNSHLLYSFICKYCEHEYFCTPQNFSITKGCTYCYNGELCDNPKCVSCLNSSFASHDMSIYWNMEKNNIDPRYVRIQSHKKYYFHCIECGRDDYLVSPNQICSNNIWCGCKLYKTETKVYDFLLSIFKDHKIMRQFSFDGIKNAKFDICIPHLNTIIEIDGDQHFGVNVSNWKGSQYTIYKDIYKMILIYHFKFRLIRLYQPDVFYDIIDWKSQLLNSIYNNLDINYISKHNIYDTHIKLFNMGLLIYENIRFGNNSELSLIIELFKFKDTGHILNISNLTDIIGEICIKFKLNKNSIKDIYENILLTPIEIIDDFTIKKVSDNNKIYSTYDLLIRQFSN